MKTIRFVTFWGSGGNRQSLPPGGRSRETNLHRPIQGKVFVLRPLSTTGVKHSHETVVLSGSTKPKSNKNK